MALQNYIFEEVPVNTVEVTGISMRSGVPVTTGWLVLDPELIVFDNDVDIYWDISTYEDPQATAEIEVSINDTTGESVQSITIHWGDGVSEEVTRGYGVVSPMAQRFSHTYDVSSANITVDATGITGLFISTNTLPLTNIPISNDIDVDQIKIWKSPHGYSPLILLDWADVTGVANPYEDTDQFYDAAYKVNVRKIDNGAPVDQSIVESSWVPAHPTGALHFTRFHSEYPVTNETLPPIQVERVDSAGYRKLDNSIVTLGVESGPGNIIGTLSKQMRNGVVVFNDLYADTEGTYSVSASATGTP